MVERELPKLAARVRFPSSAPLIGLIGETRLGLFISIDPQDSNALRVFYHAPERCTQGSEKYPEMPKTH